MKNKSYTKEEKQAYMKERVDELTTQLENGLQSFYEGDNYRRWLDMASVFPNYSLNNQILIMCQNPNAQAVCSFTAWKKMERHINAGAKGLYIFAPMKMSKELDVRKRTPGTNEVIRDENGNIIYEKKTYEYTLFKPVKVFDISETNGKDLPSLGIEELKGDVENFDKMIAAIKQVSHVPIEFGQIDGTAKGYFSSQDRKIVVREGMSELATLKTLLHEYAHSLLHNRNQKSLNVIDESSASRSDKELQAESVAYIVSKHFGLDTSDYSLGYIASWSSTHHFEGKDAEMKALKSSLDSIRACASLIIKEMEGVLLSNDKEIDVDINKSDDKLIIPDNVEMSYTGWGKVDFYSEPMEYHASSIEELLKVMDKDNAAVVEIDCDFLRKDKPELCYASVTSYENSDGEIVTDYISPSQYEKENGKVSDEIQSFCDKQATIVSSKIADTMLQLTNPHAFKELVEAKNIAEKSPYQQRILGKVSRTQSKETKSLDR